MPIFIGTAGYVYKHWRKGSFYPSSTTQSEELSYYLSRYPSVEINATWHAFPRAKTLAKWKAAAHPSTCFSLKAPKVITHTKRLLGATAEIIEFCRVAYVGLGEHLGPLLFQCSPSLPLSMTLLDGFLADVQTAREQCGVEFRVALEFRNREWFCEDVFKLLAEHDIALVNNIVVLDNDFSTLSDVAMPHCRGKDVPRAKWSYNRFHGSKNPGVSTSFPDVVLRRFAKQAAADMKRFTGFTEYSFFLNDLDAIAPKSAKRYAELVADEMSVRVKELFPGFVPEWTKNKRDITSFFKPAGSPKRSPKKRLLAGKVTDADESGRVENHAVKKPRILFATKSSPRAKSSPIQTKSRDGSKSKDIASYFAVRSDKG